MANTFTHKFDTPNFKGSVTINTDLFIGGKFVPPVEGGKIDVYNPITGKVLTAIAGGTSKDIDLAVEAASKAYKTAWGYNVPAKERGRLILKLVDLLEKHADELSALEALNMGKPYFFAKQMDIGLSIDNFRYYAGWADKIHGQTLETNDTRFCYTRHEPFGVVGQIIPWNFPLWMLSWKVAPALATGNTIILKPSEVTPLTAQFFAQLVIEAGFPPGVVNIVNGYGPTAGQAIAEHPKIDKIAFTGSTLVGRKIQIASANSNLKAVSLELGGKNPMIIFDDADLEQTINWTVRGAFGNVGQVCSAGSRILVQEGIYDQFVAILTATAKGLSQAIGDNFSDGVIHAPVVSQAQFDRVVGYIEAGKAEGATLVTGGERQGNEGYYIEPTLFADTKPDMKIVKEEIFGPVGILIKFKTEEEAIALANDTPYGLASGVFTQDNSRAIRLSNALEAGTVWVNCYNTFSSGLPFGGYKQSGNGRELGQYALDTYTHVKAVQVNIGERL